MGTIDDGHFPGRVEVVPNDGAGQQVSLLFLGSLREDLLKRTMP